MKHAGYELRQASARQSGVYPARARGAAPRAGGFTLMELMIAIVIMTIVVTLGVPNLFSFIQNSRATAYANDLVTALNIARSEAVRRGQATVLCPRTDDGDPDCGGDGWENGWLVCRDASPGANVPTCTGAPADILWSRGALAGEPTFSASAGANWIRYLARGGIETPTALAGENTAIARLELGFALDRCRGDQARQITVTTAGRPSARRAPCPS